MFSLYQTLLRRAEVSTSTASLVVSALMLCLYVIGIVGYPLADPDEPVYGQVAKEMATTGRWLTPRYDGRPWFDKPPLYYWISAASARVVGPNTEAASRLPSAIFGAALVGLVMLLGSSELGRGTGLLSAIVMGSCIQQIVLAHSAVTDMTFVFFLTASLVAYRRWLGSAKTSVLWAVLIGMMAGLATLTKGPVAPVMLSATFFLDLWLAKNLKRLWNWDALAAVGSLLVVALPWYVTMYKLHGEQFVQGFLVANNITRFIKPEHVSQTGNWFSYFRNFGVLLLFFFPWSGFLPQAIKLAWRKNDCLRLCIIWTAVVFVFFSVSKTQLVTYIFPLYPAVAVLVGDLWSSAMSGKLSSERGIRAGVWFTSIVGLLIAVGLVAISRSKFPEAERASAEVAAILIIAATASVILVVRTRGERLAGVVWLWGGGMIAFMLVLMLGVAPLVGPYVSTRGIVRVLLRNPNATVAQFDSDVPSLLFYLGKSPQRIADVASARTLMRQPSPTYLICKMQWVPSVLTADMTVVARDGKRALIANQPAVSSEESEYAR